MADKLLVMSVSQRDHALEKVDELAGVRAAAKVKVNALCSGKGGHMQRRKGGRGCVPWAQGCTSRLNTPFAIGTQRIPMLAPALTCSSSCPWKPEDHTPPRMRLPTYIVDVFYVDAVLVCAMLQDQLLQIEEGPLVCHMLSQLRRGGAVGMSRPAHIWNRALRMESALLDLHGSSDPLHLMKGGHSTLPPPHIFSSLPCHLLP